MSGLFKPLQTVLGIVLVAAMIFVVVNRVAPGWVAEARIWLGNPASWSAEAKRHDPVGYLRHVRGKLTRQKDQLRTITQDIRTNMVPLEAHISENREELAKTQAFLKEGRGLYQQATASTTRVDAVKFAGRVYSGLDQSGTGISTV